MTKEKILGIDTCAGPHWREFHLTISYYMVSFGEKESLIWDSLFYYVKEILVKGLFHEQRGFTMFILPLTLKFLSQVNELKIFYDLYSSQPTRYGFSNFIFLTTAFFCAGNTFAIWPSTWPWRVVSLEIASKPTLGDTFMIRLNTELTHAIWVFPLCFDGIFFFLHEETKQINSEFVFWWYLFLVMPAYVFNRVFKATSHFITILSKLTSIQTIVLLLLPIC